MLLSFSAHVYKWKENHPLKAVRFFTFTCQLSGQNAQILNVKFFNHQIIADLPQNATEMVTSLKYVRVF